MESRVELVSQRFPVGPVWVDALQLGEAVARMLGSDRPQKVHLCNAYTVALASKDPVLTECLANSSLNLADGYPIAWVARRQGLRHMRERVSGPDFMRSCLDKGRAVGLRHYLYGSTSEVLAAMVTRIEEHWPGAELVGFESAPFRTLDDADRLSAARRFEEAGADVVWVGLGTPKQDYEVERLANVSPASFVAIGAAFDFIAGTKTQPPNWAQRGGMEWMFRLLSEPRRLWRRYLVGLPVFGWIAVRQLVWRRGVTPPEDRVQSR